MAAESNQNALDSARRDVGNAVKMGKDAAKTAKTVGKAAAQAASGNVVGAAVTALKDPAVVRIMLLVFLFPVILLVTVIIFFLYALPTAIFEAVTSYLDKIAEDWAQGVYSSDGGVIMAGIVESLKSGGRIIADAVSTAGAFVADLWNGLTSWFTADSSSGSDGQRVDDNIETLDDQALHVTQNEQAETETLLAKVDACRQKISLRQNQIRDAILGKQGAINGLFKKKFEGTYDLWGGTTLNVIAPEISQSEAIRLLSAYTVVEGASLQDMRLSDFLKWLGYYREFTGDHTVFNLGGDTLFVNAAVKTWCGTFMPQYLVEQRNQDIEAIVKEKVEKKEEYDQDEIRAEVKRQYEQYQGPATDLLMVVNCPDFTTIQPQYSTVKSGDKELVVCSVSVVISIETRSVDSLASDVIGFWAGPVSDAESAESDAGARPAA